MVQTVRQKHEAAAQREREQIFEKIWARAVARGIKIEVSKTGIYPMLWTERACLEVYAQYHQISRSFAGTRVKVESRRYLPGGKRTRSFQKIDDKNIEKILDVLLKIDREVAKIDEHERESQQRLRAGRAAAEEVLRELNLSPEEAAYPADVQVRVLDAHMQGLRVICAPDGSFTVKLGELTARDAAALKHLIKALDEPFYEVHLREIDDAKRDEVPS